MNAKNPLYMPGVGRTTGRIAVASLLLLECVVPGKSPALAAATQSTPQGPQRPNVVLIVSDDHGVDDLGCYGNQVIKTPNLDALASDGIRFTQAFCTTASCSPSRAVILSGLQSHRNGMYGLQHQEHHFQAFDTVKGLPVLLSAAGIGPPELGSFTSPRKRRSRLKRCSPEVRPTIRRQSAEARWKWPKVYESSSPHVTIGHSSYISPRTIRTEPIP